jgi:hypothetical protein
VGDTLLQAQKAIDIDGNYNVAASLFNSLSGELYSCKPLLQANPDLMIITILTMFIIFGIITIARNYKEKRKEELTKSETIYEKIHEKKFVKKSLPSHIPKLNDLFRKFGWLKNIQILLFTPLYTIVFLPLVFVF